MLPLTMKKFPTRSRKQYKFAMPLVVTLRVGA